MSRFKRLSVSFSVLCLGFATFAAPTAWSQDTSRCIESAAAHGGTGGRCCRPPHLPPTTGSCWSAVPWCLFMTAPGLAMFYGGLVRRKNVLSVMMQCIFLMGLMTVIWAVYGYSLAFGGSGGWIGNTEYLFMNGVQRHWDEATNSVVTPIDGEDRDSNSHAVSRHVLHHHPGFDLRCVCRTDEVQRDGRLLDSVGDVHLLPAMSLGLGWWTAVLWRRQHRRWCTRLCRWNGGSYQQRHLGTGCGDLDRPANGVHERADPASQLDLHSTRCAAMLWFGWFGFNAGSELLSDDLTSSAFAVTHFSAAAGAVAWALTEWVVLEEADGSWRQQWCGCRSGLHHSRSRIRTADAGTARWERLAGVICYMACSKLKHTLKYDDALDAFGVHGIGGMLGAVLTGVFATRACWDVTEKGQAIGLIESGGDPSLVIGQLAAVGVTIAFAGIGSVILLKAIDIVMGLRVHSRKRTARIGRHRPR